jgi:hypothetical protein
MPKQKEAKVWQLFSAVKDEKLRQELLDNMLPQAKHVYRIHLHEAISCGILWVGDMKNPDMERYKYWSNLHEKAKNNKIKYKIRKEDYEL